MAVSAWEQEVLADNPANLWRFNDTTTAQLTDSVGTAHGTFTSGSADALLGGSPVLGAARSAAGVPGGIRFGGRGGGSYGPSITTSNIAVAYSSFTIEGVFCWYGWNSTGMSGLWQIGGESNFMVRVGTYLGSRPGQINGWVIPDPGPANDLKLGETYHVAVTYDNSTRAVNVYVNGRLIAETTNGPQFGIAEGNLQAPWDYGNGRESDVLIMGMAITKAALSDTRIAAHAAAVTPLFSAITQSATSPNSYESAPNLLDQIPGTKWLANSATGNVQWTTTPAKTATAYSLTSGNDAPDRDPKAWTLYGSNDGGTTWQAIDARSGETFTARGQVKEYQIASPASYSRYKLDVTANNGASGLLQLADVSLTAAAPAGLTLNLPAVTVTGAAKALRAVLPLTLALGVAAGTVSAQPLSSSAPLNLPLPAATATAAAHPLNARVAARLDLPAVSVAATAYPLLLPGDAPITLPLPAAAATATALPLTVQDTLWGGEPTYLELVTAPGELIADPPLALPPAGMTERVMTRQSVVLDPATLVPDAAGRVRAKAGDYTVTGGAVGTPHLIVDGVDVTYFRGIPTPPPSFETAQPFGDVSASLSFPQITPLDQPGSGDLAWLRHEAPVEILLRRTDGTVTRLWAGHLITDDTGHDQASSEQDWQAHGALYQASLQGHRVPITLDPTDIGSVIPAALNGVVSRRYPAIPRTATGIVTTQRGSYTDSELAYCQELLATAWTQDERQWTLAKRAGTDRSYQLQLKDRATIQWTITTGTPGVELRLSRDTTSVVRCIYGRGVRSDGYSWAGWVWPSLLSDDAPDYPFTDPDLSIVQGMTDASTSSGTGVTTWQQRAVELGYTIAVDGAYGTADADVARQIQRRYGLLVDGVVGPQTWAATFAVGSHAGDLSGAFRMPLAVDQRCEPNRYATNGRLLGANPAYDPQVLRIEREIDYGTGIDKATAKADAQRQINRDADPAWIGSITLAVDPREDSRWLIRPGDNLRVLGWQGGTLTLHVVGVRADLAGGTVTLDVDEHARDALTLAQIRARNKDSRVDPARRPGNVNRRSRNAQDTVVEYDGESGAGIIPRHAIRQGLWTVVYIPVSQVGHAAKLYFQTDSPASKFCIALFASPIEPAHLVDIVGNPLTGSDPFNKSEAQADRLDSFGFIEAFGGPGSAAGYWPGSEGQTPLSGKLLDTGGFDYVSNRGGWVWVAEYSPVSTFIHGRIWPAPMSV